MADADEGLGSGAGGLALGDEVGIPVCLDGLAEGEDAEEGDAKGGPGQSQQAPDGAPDAPSRLGADPYEREAHGRLDEGDGHDVDADPDDAELLRLGLHPHVHVDVLGADAHGDAMHSKARVGNVDELL